jgi:hypothetical protein
MTEFDRGKMRNLFIFGDSWYDIHILEQRCGATALMEAGHKREERALATQDEKSFLGSSQMWQRGVKL